MKKYIWEKEIKDIKWDIVTFTDDSTMSYTDKELGYLVTKEPSDPTKMRELVFQNVIPKLMQVLEDYNVRQWDISAVLNGCQEIYKQKLETAVWKAFWTYEKGLHYRYFTENIRCSDINKIIS